MTTFSILCMFGFAICAKKSGFDFIINLQLTTKQVNNFKKKEVLLEKKKDVCIFQHSFFKLESCRFAR